jgi:transcriptional regulator with XRE-family HTH domain
MGSVKVSFSENLRALRRGKNKTQEELSAALNVAPQTISKWERGESYPDFPLLPPLAAYFDVSLDELVGMSEYRSKERRNELLFKGRGLAIQAKFMEALPILRDALTMFPGDVEIMFQLANAFDGAVSHKMAPEDDCGKYTDEAVSLLERLIDSTAPRAWLFRSSYLNVLIRILKRTGEIEKATELAKRQPRVSDGREILLAELDDDGSRQAQESLMSTFYGEYDAELRKAADRASKRGDTEKALYFLQKQLALGDWFYDDPRDAQLLEVSRWHLYGEFAMTYAARGDTDSAMAWLNRAVDSAVICPMNGVFFSGTMYEDEAERERTRESTIASFAEVEATPSFAVVRAKAFSGLVKNMDVGYSTITHPIDAITILLTKDRWDAIRADERFREIERRLKEARSVE